ncbi:hypothetical protein BDR03DRAFT_80058 [Suillus americanus]|nr:hypothetical protein BDR03DRAFT_80058 [Suillus americanus]
MPSFAGTAARGSIRSQLEQSTLTRFHARSSISQLYVNSANPLRHRYIIDLSYIKPHRHTFSYLFNHNTQSMSYDQENQGSRRNFNDDSNYDTPGDDKRTVPGGDSTLSESYGGSGTGQAGGYKGNQGRVGRQGQQSSDRGDEYCDTDPGMAGNRGGQDGQNMNVPGVGQIGGEHDSGQSIGGDGRSRGYERDVDEYDDSGIGSGQGAGAGTGRGPTSKLSSISSKLMGGVEKMAGKLSKDPEREAQGEQRKSGF